MIPCANIWKTDPFRPFSVSVDPASDGSPSSRPGCQMAPVGFCGVTARPSVGKIRSYGTQPAGGVPVMNGTIAPAVTL